MNSALDELVKPENWSYISMVWRGEGYPADVAEEAAAELAELRASLGEARKIIKDLLLSQPDEEIWSPAIAWHDKNTPSCPTAIRETVIY